MYVAAAAAAAKSLQSCPTLWDPIDGSPPGSPVPGILQARTLEWVAISFSSAWKWKVKGKSVVSDSQRPHGLQPTRLLGPWDFPGKSTGVGCHCLLWYVRYKYLISNISHFSLFHIDSKVKPVITLLFYITLGKKNMYTCGRFVLMFGKTNTVFEV